RDNVPRDVRQRPQGRGTTSSGTWEHVPRDMGEHAYVINITVTRVLARDGAPARRRRAAGETPAPHRKLARSDRWAPALLLPLHDVDKVKPSIPSRLGA